MQPPAYSAPPKRTADKEQVVVDEKPVDSQSMGEVIDSPRNGVTEATSKTGVTSYDYDVEETTKGGFTKGEQMEHYTTATATRYDDMHDDHKQNHLNSLFNGHLMKWKFEAEEGSAFIRIPAFVGAIGLIATTIAALVIEPDAWTSHSIVMSVCVLFMAIFIVILDGRFLATNPLSVRAHLRNIITRNFNIFRYVWGRSLLYLMAGILNVAQLWLITEISGFYMLFVGFVALGVGIHASRKFAALRSSLADESFLLLAFSTFDNDGDGYLEPNEFANLLADLGMELDDRYTLKAFNVIDTDNDRRISFREFNNWWSAGYIERGRRRHDSDEYHRLE